MNPMKRRLVSHPKDWTWSSFSFYTKKEPVSFASIPGVDSNREAKSPSLPKGGRLGHPNFKISRQAWASRPVTPAPIV